MQKQKYKKPARQKQKRFNAVKSEWTSPRLSVHKLPAVLKDVAGSRPLTKKLWPGFQNSPVECDEITAEYRWNPKNSLDGILRSH